MSGERWVGRAAGKVGTMEAAREVLRRGGALGFFSGATPSIARSFIVSGSRFTAFSGAMGFSERCGERVSGTSRIAPIVGMTVDSVRLPSSSAKFEQTRAD